MTDSYGTRILQRLIEKICQTDHITEVLKQFKGRVYEMVMSNNANHVIQKAIAHISQSQADFIYLEILESYKEIGCHKHGCCVIQRCIDYCSEERRVTPVYEDQFS